MNPKSIGALLVISIFLLSNVSIAFAAQWVAVGRAPSTSGTYSLTIRAEYGDKGVVGTYPLSFWVANAAQGNEDLEVDPLFQQDIEPPIMLKFIATVNETPIDDIVTSNVTVFFSFDGDTIQSEADPLQMNEAGELWTLADVPFEGNYQAEIFLSILKNNSIYNRTFMTEFYSDYPSPYLDMNAFIRDRVFLPGDSIGVYANLSFRGERMEGVNIYRASLNGVQTPLEWDSELRIYKTVLTAPEDEGIYELQIYAVRQGYLKNERIYVLDRSGRQSGMCPVTPTNANCNSMEEVRRCVGDYIDGQSYISEAMAIQCFETGYSRPPVRAFVCNGSRIGDLDGDYHLDVDDLSILENQILSFDNQEARNSYIACADYDLDGDVDEDDLVCLTNVVAGKWWGDFNGGYCFDIVFDSALPGDVYKGDMQITSGDYQIIGKIKNISSQGVELHDKILQAVDFNQDGAVDDTDLYCASRFIGLRMDEIEATTLNDPIPAYCFEIFNTDYCAGIRGDLNGDLEIDVKDELLIMLAKRGVLPDSMYSLECADVNLDGRITYEDELCVKAYVSGDTDKYFVCLGCTDNTPPLYRRAVEICNDGYDNDCDGLVDKTSTDPESDECMCGEHTKCWRLWDNDAGTSPGTADGNVLVCRKTSWNAAAEAIPEGAQFDINEYQWIAPSELTCDKDKECESFWCQGQEYTCAFDGYTTPMWYEYCMVPIESNTSPTCEDGWDNNCKDGDMDCLPENIWESPSQLLAGLVSGVLTFYGGPLVGMLVSMGGSYAFPEYAQGIAIGSLIGGVAGGMMGSGAASAGTTGAEAAGGLNSAGGPLGSGLAGPGTGVANAAGQGASTGMMGKIGSYAWSNAAAGTLAGMVSSSWLQYGMIGAGAAGGYFIGSSQNFGEPAELEATWESRCAGEVDEETAKALEAADDVEESVDRVGDSIEGLLDD
jgi:hypothetical protein